MIEHNNNNKGSRASALKALNMKIAAVMAIMNGTVEGQAKEKTFAFLDKPHEQLKEEINQGKYKNWRR